MKLNNIAGIIALMAGLLFIALSVFYKDFLSQIVGLNLISIGILTLIFRGWKIRNSSNKIFINISLILGCVLIIFGLALIFSMDSLSFLIDFEYYIIGIILIILGINGFLLNINRIHDISSLITAVIGITSIYLTSNPLNNPVYIAIILGFILFTEAFALIISS